MGGRKDVNTEFLRGKEQYKAARLQIGRFKRHFCIDK